MGGGCQTRFRHGACRREGYNVLAIGQHLDDLAESVSLRVDGGVRTVFRHGACRREGYNVLAIGQLLDDFAESVSCLLYTFPRPPDQRGSRMPPSSSVT